jgi:hypothetical protein
MSTARCIKACLDKLTTEEQGITEEEVITQESVADRA